MPGSGLAPNLNQRQADDRRNLQRRVRVNGAVEGRRTSSRRWSGGWGRAGKGRAGSDECDVLDESDCRYQCDQSCTKAGDRLKGAARGRGSEGAKLRGKKSEGGFQQQKQLAVKRLFRPLGHSQKKEGPFQPAACAARRQTGSQQKSEFGYILVKSRAGEAKKSRLVPPTRWLIGFSRACGSQLPPTCGESDTQFGFLASTSLTHTP
ncbi:hypothetical protein COCMIDRAFT_27594 [Bipolaris oryzae ATCC 44560]|uniref:Uncharacterized protein n=1 Tax=Bipolaris oryzae ATCC 44560 TaxID=930090 RepID=W6YX60_COCMI|nr:uncharacterized protein COCMIDRAFT_27594 [Bipolaris oryzae ATCC 44560]EUC43982.1 hypothetical protein COCMIDRAFT_27594 [Bipolaris oryzae ATCC 44560]